MSGPESVRRRVPDDHFSAGNRHRRRQVGNTAFLFAAKSADVEVMRLLVENGADPKMNTLLNITPLMLTAGIAWAANQDTASEEQVLDAVKYLVEELGADVNFVADTGETAMHAAAYRGANSVVQYLFDKGATLDVVDKIGRTPLTVAEGGEYGNSFASHPHTAELLRKLGANEIPCPGLCANIRPWRVGFCRRCFRLGSSATATAAGCRGQRRAEYALDETCNIDVHIE